MSARISSWYKEALDQRGSSSGMGMRRFTYFGGSCLDGFASNPSETNAWFSRWLDLLEGLVQQADEEIRTLDPLLGKEMLYH